MFTLPQQTRTIYSHYMTTDKPREVHLQELKKDYFLAPGYYMNFWKESVLPNFTVKQVAFHHNLKEHREMWIGAHLAALKTKLSGVQHLVALPDSDPPDVVIGAFKQIKTPKGRRAYNLDWYPVENTRCDMSAGETLEGQIEKKNKYANGNLILTVYLQGAEVVPDLKKLHLSLVAKEKFYPHEVIIMVQLKGDENGLPSESFGFVQVYPNYDTIVLQRNDKGAYFDEPNIMKVTGRGVQESIERVGVITLVPPQIKQR